MLASLQQQLRAGLAYHALQTQHNLLRGLGLLVENGLGLTTVTLLLTVVSALTLGKQRRLAGLVLRHLVLRVLAALLAFAVRLSRLGYVNCTLVSLSLALPRALHTHCSSMPSACTWPSEKISVLESQLSRLWSRELLTNAAIFQVTCG